MDFLNDFQQSFDAISKLSTASAIVNFLASCITACLAFQVYIKLVSTVDDLVVRFATMRKIRADFGADYYSFLFLYSCLTGFVTSAFICVQFSSTLNVSYSILYGACGPYLFRSKLAKFITEPEGRMQVNVVSSYKEQLGTIDKENQEETEKTEIDYSETLKKLKKKLTDPPSDKDNDDDKQ